MDNIWQVKIKIFVSGRLIKKHSLDDQRYITYVMLLRENISISIYLSSLDEREVIVKYAGQPQLMEILKHQVPKQMQRAQVCLYSCNNHLMTAK